MASPRDNNIARHLQESIPKGLPENIADRVSFATSGIKTANQVDEVSILWREFKKCYASEKLALEAVSDAARDDDEQEDEALDDENSAEQQLVDHLDI